MSEMVFERDNSRELAKQVVKQWEQHDRFRVVAGEGDTEPSEVVIAKALLRVDKEYGCEVRDPCGTIWQYAAKLEQEVAELAKERDALRAAMQSHRKELR